MFPQDTIRSSVRAKFVAGSGSTSLILSGDDSISFDDVEMVSTWLRMLPTRPRFGVRRTPHENGDLCDRKTSAA